MAITINYMSFQLSIYENEGLCLTKLHVIKLKLQITMSVNDMTLYTILHSMFHSRISTPLFSHVH